MYTDTDTQTQKDTQTNANPRTHTHTHKYTHTHTHTNTHIGQKGIAAACLIGRLGHSARFSHVLQELWRLQCVCDREEGSEGGSE